MKYRYEKGRLLLTCTEEKIISNEDAEEAKLAVIYLEGEHADTLMHHGLGDWVHKLYEDIKPTYEASGFVLRYLEIPNLQWLDDLNDCINISGTKKLTKLRIEVENYDPNRSLAESIFRSLHA